MRERPLDPELSPDCPTLVHWRGSGSASTREARSNPTLPRWKRSRTRHPEGSPSPGTGCHRTSRRALRTASIDWTNKRLRGKTEVVWDGNSTTARRVWLGFGTTNISFASTATTSSPSAATVSRLSSPSAPLPDTRRAGGEKTLDPGKRASRCGHRGGLARGRDGPAGTWTRRTRARRCVWTSGRRGETPPRATRKKKARRRGTSRRWRPKRWRPSASRRALLGKRERRSDATGDPACARRGRSASRDRPRNVDHTRTFAAT